MVPLSLTLGGRWALDGGPFAPMLQGSHFGRWGLLEWRAPSPETPANPHAFEHFIEANPILW